MASTAPKLSSPGSTSAAAAFDSIPHSPIPTHRNCSRWKRGSPIPMNNGQIEQALYITRKDQLRLVADEHVRLYFGNEFCQQLIPRPCNLEEVLDFAASEELGFTFLTPYVTDAGLRRLSDFLAIVASALPGSEVVFNDWGVLSMLQDNYPTLAPVMGRLLNKMKRGPRLLNFLDIT